MEQNELITFYETLIEDLIDHEGAEEFSPHTCEMIDKFYEIKFKNTS